MPNAPRRTCPTPHCGRLVPAGERVCRRCRQRAEKLRGSARARGYDATWANYSRAWLTLHPWCGERADGQLHAEHSRCVQAGRRTRADVTDHIRALRDGGARLDPANHQSLCRSCNTAKDAARGPRL